MDDTLLVTKKEAQKLLCVGRNTLWEWERHNFGPMPVNIGRQDARNRTIRYRLADIRAFIEERSS